MHKSQQSSARFHFIDKPEEKLETANKELRMSRRANSDPHSTVDGRHGGPGPTRYTIIRFIPHIFFYIGAVLNEECIFSFDRSEPGAPPHDIETLLRKLVEAEIDGQAAAKQVAVLRETVGKLRKVRWSNCVFLDV